MNPLTLDGIEGGGQLLRTSLSLSAVTGIPFRMTRIRGGRSKPGLMRQHLTCVQAAQEICGATVDGAALGSQELLFQPGKIRGGDFHFAIGTGGSTTLVLQTLLPIVLHAPSPSTVRIEGATHNPLAPPFEFLEQCYLPRLQSMGVKASITLERPGFMQAAGGAVVAKVQPILRWRKLALEQRGRFVGHFGIVLNAHLAESIPNRQIAAAAKELHWDASLIRLQSAQQSVGPGNIIMLGARFEHVTEICSSVAQIGRSAESVAESAAKGLRNYLNNGAPVGVHLADQLLLPMALAGGGSFSTFGLSRHTVSHMALIPKFLEVRFEVRDGESGMKQIICSRV